MGGQIDGRSTGYSNPVNVSGAEGQTARLPGELESVVVRINSLAVRAEYISRLLCEKLAPLLPQEPEPQNKDSDYVWEPANARFYNDVGTELRRLESALEAAEKTINRAIL